jgi:hypothetical protein
MKTNHLILVVLCGLISSGGSDQAPVTAARITSPIADGTPPPPAPEKPKFVVRPQKVLSRETHFEGGRKITLQKITPIELPPPPEAVVPREVTPAMRELMAQYRAQHARKTIVPLSAIIYRSARSAPRTLVTYSPQPDRPLDGKPAIPVPSVTFWSSADFALLLGFADFKGSDGQTRSLMMSWNSYDLETLRARSLKYKKTARLPTIPALPDGPATFLITQGNPRPQDLAVIQSLHDLYNNEHTRLQAAHEGRERLRLAQEAEKKANPPQPQDLVLNHWRTPKNNQEGADR